MKVRVVNVEKHLGEVTYKGVGFRLFKEELEIQFATGNAVRVSLEDIALEATEPSQADESPRVKRSYNKKVKDWLDVEGLGKAIGPLLKYPKKALSTWTVRRLIATFEGVGPHLTTKPGERKNSTLYSKTIIPILVLKYNTHQDIFKEQSRIQAKRMQPLGMAALTKIRSEKNGVSAATVN